MGKTTAQPPVFLMVGNSANSLVNFRGQLLKDIRDSGYQVHVAAPDLAPDTSAFRWAKENNIIVHEIPMNRASLNPFVDLKFLWRLFVLMRNIRPRIILTYTIKPVVYGTLAAWLAHVDQRFALIPGLGYAFTGEAHGKRALVRRVVKVLYKLALARTTKVFFQNPDDEALFRIKKIINAQLPSVVVNGSGVDLQRFPVMPLPSGVIRFLLIGRLLGDKGVREYVYAARKLVAAGHKATFSLLGGLDSNPDSITKTELRQWEKEKVIDYLGQVPDVRDVLSKSSVFVLPSYREGTPRSTLEAMSMGRPIITTDTPGCRETVINCTNGYLVPVKDVDALATAMCQFIEDPIKISYMGKLSRQIAEARYDVHKVNAVMLEGMGVKGLDGTDRSTPAMIKRL